MLTSDDVEDILETYGFRAQELANLLGVSDPTVRRWRAKKGPLPDPGPGSLRLLVLLRSVQPGLRLGLGASIRSALVLHPLKGLFVLLSETLPLAALPAAVRERAEAWKTGRRVRLAALVPCSVCGNPARSSAKTCGNDVCMAKHALQSGRLQHGKYRSYAQAGCRCEDCTRVSYEKHCAWKAQAKARAADDAPHGTASGYNNWGCRCEPCLVAGRAAQKRQRDKHKHKHKKPVSGPDGP